MSTTDRETYAGYVASRLAAFTEHAGDTARVWDFDAMQRARRPFAEDADAFKGPWRDVRPYVTTEFREWIDEYSAERLTCSEWHAAQLDERRQLATRERAYLDSAAYCTDRLERWAELNRERDELIVEARERGASLREIQESTGLSRMAVHNILAWAKLQPQPIAVVEWIEAEDGAWIEVAA